AKFPFEEYIDPNSYILHSIYVDTQRYGITFVYPTLDRTPALVKWGLDLLGSEYQKLENKRTEQINKTPQGSAHANRK
ncbi:hypothetical protein KDA08_02840, partial [Candidatus Saccharibacteria bacterium]|nr:hypothetical protein [Candidatus Saccharibacteria bacterium]